MCRVRFFSSSWHKGKVAGGSQEPSFLSSWGRTGEKPVQHSMGPRRCRWLRGPHTLGEASRTSENVSSDEKDPEEFLNIYGKQRELMKVPPFPKEGRSN